MIYFFYTNHYLYLIEQQVNMGLRSGNFFKWDELRVGNQGDMTFVSLDLFFKNNFCKVL